MMSLNIELQNIGHSFKGGSLFEGINYTFSSDSSVAILGHNGSGKSTLLKIISSFVQPTEGCIRYSIDHQELELYQVKNQFSICSPYLQLEENFSLSEAYDFHFSLRTSVNGISKSDFFNEIGLSHVIHKSIKQLSTGMTQRLKLGFAFFTDSTMLLLDEPCSNLDADGMHMYASFIEKFADKRGQIICSNDVSIEFAHCNAEINVSEFKSN